jgi:hypothetical protein
LLKALQHVEDDSRRHASQQNSSQGDSLSVLSHPPAKERILQLQVLLRTEDPFR